MARLEGLLDGCGTDLESPCSNFGAQLEPGFDRQEVLDLVAHARSQSFIVTTCEPDLMERDLRSLTDEESRLVSLTPNFEGGSHWYQLAA